MSRNSNKVGQSPAGTSRATRLTDTSASSLTRSPCALRCVSAVQRGRSGQDDDENGGKDPVRVQAGKKAVANRSHEELSEQGRRGGQARGRQNGGGNRGQQRSTTPPSSLLPAVALTHPAWTVLMLCMD